ncbi:MAG: hypothetical protein ACLP1E_10825 [Acidimicrobiales bacterium]
MTACLGQKMSAAMCVLGGVVAAIGIRIPADLGRRRTESSRHPCAHCALDAPPLGEKN